MCPYNTQQNKHKRKKLQHTQHNTKLHHAHRCSRPLYSSHTPHQPQPQANKKPFTHSHDGQRTTHKCCPRHPTTCQHTKKMIPTQPSENRMQTKKTNHAATHTPTNRCITKATAKNTDHPQLQEQSVHNKNSLERR